MYIFFSFTEMLYIMEIRLFLCLVDDLYSPREQRLLLVIGPFRFSH